MNTMQHTMAPASSVRSKVMANNVVRIVLGLLAVCAGMAAAFILSEQFPKPVRIVWPHLLAATFCLLGYALYVRAVEKRTAMPELARAGLLAELGKGVGGGAAIGLAVAGLLALCGAFAVTGSSDPAVILKTFPEQVFVAIFEELLFHAVLFRIIEQRWSSRSALLVTLVLFVLAHLPNEHVSVLGMLITGVAAVALGGAYMLTRRIWLPVGMHFGWNFLYDGVFAVPVSGHPARGWLQVAMPGPEWLSGGTYGVEASAATLLVWGAAAVVLLRKAEWR